MRNSQEKNRDKDSRAIGNERTSSTTTTTEREFVDNSTEGIEARRLQEVADNSPDALEMLAYQQSIDNNSEVLMEEYQDEIQDTNVESSYEIVDNGVGQYYIELLDRELQNMEGILKNVGGIDDSTKINTYIKDYVKQLLSANKRHIWSIQLEDLENEAYAETEDDCTFICQKTLLMDDLMHTLIHELTHSLGTLDIAYTHELMFQFLGENEDWQSNADSLAFVILDIYEHKQNYCGTLEIEESNISSIHEKYGTADKQVTLDSKDEVLKSKVEKLGAIAIGKLQLMLREILEVMRSNTFCKYSRIEGEISEEEQKCADIQAHVCYDIISLTTNDEIVTTIDENQLDFEMKLISKMVGDEKMNFLKEMIYWKYEEGIEAVLKWPIDELIGEMYYSVSEEDSSSLIEEEDTQEVMDLESLPEDTLEKVPEDTANGTKKRKREESDEDSRGMPEKKRRLEKENEQENIKKMDVVDQRIFQPVNAEEYQQNMELIQENTGKTVWQLMVSGFPYESYLLSDQQVIALRGNHLISTVPDGDCSINAVLESLGEEGRLNEIRAQLATNAYNDGVVDEEAAQEILQPGNYDYSNVTLLSLAQLLNVQITIIEESGNEVVVGADNAERRIRIYHVVKNEIGHYYGSK
jgi:hypothetical protein